MDGPVAVPAGWYPVGETLRYWDGERWTDIPVPEQPRAKASASQSLGCGTRILLFLLLSVLLAPSRWVVSTGHSWWLLATVPMTVVVFFVIVGIATRSEP